MVVILVIVSLLFLNAAVCEEDETDFALNYLTNFGYISKTRSGNHDPKTAIKGFQSFFGLPETGELDDETIYQMKKPRCGVPDVYNENGRVKRSPYPGTVRKWRQTYFTYFVYKGEDLPESEQQRIFAKAFNIWKAAAPRLRFTREKTQEYEPTKADLKISFGKERHSGTPFEPRCTTVFDGKGGMVAHAYAPREGRIHFDDDEKWTEKGGFWSRSQSLLFTAVHEIGHALGLNHSNRKDSVMWPEAQKGVPKLSSEDVRAIRQLFN